MSKVKQSIEKAIECVNNAGHNTYGASIYTFNQVHAILQDILDTVNEDVETETTGAVITQTDIDELVEALEERIYKNKNYIHDSDIVDSDSLEASIYNGRVTIESIDIDKDNIISEAQYNLEEVINKWAYEHKLVIQN
jgi:hypothetical protein